MKHVEAYGSRRADQGKMKIHAMKPGQSRLTLCGHDCLAFDGVTWRETRKAATCKICIGMEAKMGS